MRTLKALAPGMVMILVSLVFLSQTFVMEKASLLDPASGSFLPALISIVMLLTGIFILIQERPKKQMVVEEGNIESIEKDSKHILDEDEVRMNMKQYYFILAYFLLIIVYVFLISFLSFMVATFIFLFVSMIYLKDVSWKTNIIVSIASVVMIDLVFTRLFHIIFP